MKTITLFMSIVLLLVFLLYCGVVVFKGITFTIGCSDRLKRAADANTVEIATKEVEAALKYIEQKNLTEGYTSVLYNTPDEDIGFWYRNIKASLDELKLSKPDATQLEKSNLLMKLTETLLDASARGVRVTHPHGISLFPHNVLFFVWGIVSFILSLIGVPLILRMQ